MRFLKVLFVIFVSHSALAAKAPSCGEKFYKQSQVGNNDWGEGTSSYLKELYVNNIKGKDLTHLPAVEKRFLELMNTTKPSRGTMKSKPDGAPPKVMDDSRAESIKAEIKVAETLARKGYQTRYASEANTADRVFKERKAELRKEHGLSSTADFDLVVENKPFDVYYPQFAKTPEKVIEMVRKKTEGEGHSTAYLQTQRVAIYVDSKSFLSKEENRKNLTKQLRSSPPDRLREILAISENGDIERLFP